MSHASLPKQAASLDAHLRRGGNGGVLRGRGHPSQPGSAGGDAQHFISWTEHPAQENVPGINKAAGSLVLNACAQCCCRCTMSKQHRKDTSLTSLRPASSPGLARVKRGPQACSLLLAAPLQLHNERHKGDSLAISGAADVGIGQGEGRKEVVQDRVCLLLPCIVVGEEAAGPSHGCLAQAYRYCEQHGAAQHLGVGPVCLSLLPPAATLIG